MSAISNETVAVIISRLQQGEKRADLAREYEVSYQTIQRIYTGVRTASPRKKTRVNFTKPVLERFEIQPDGCWHYTGHINRDGYGVSNGSPVHRVFFEQMVGAISPGMQVDHLCGIRRCVNPAHLEQVSQRVNLARAGFGTFARGTRT